MGRWHCTLAGLMALAAVSSGCAANRPGNPFANMGGKSTPRLGKKSAADDPQLADQKSTAADRGTNATSSGSKAPTDGDPSRGDPPAIRGAQTDGHDAVTMAYIESELRDATPEERAAQLNGLRGLHPQAVRQILRSRRMAINYRAGQEMAANRNPATIRDGTVQPAVAEKMQIASRGTKRANTTEGLGTASAWSRQPGDGGRASPNAIADGENTSWSQNGAGPPQVAGQPPVGHNSAYRVDPEVQNAAVTGYSGAPTASGPPPGPSIGTRQLTGGQFQVAQAGGPPPAGVSRGSGVKAAVAVGAPMSTATSSQAANSAAATIPAGEGAARDYLLRLISATEAEAYEIQPGESPSEKQSYIEKQVHLRMLYLMSGQQERALQAIPGLEPADQEFWQQTFWGLTNYFDVNSIPSSADRAAQTVTQMTNAVLRLQEKANLELRNVTFCHKISSFGNYEKFSRDEFSPGQEVLLYADVANIHSEPIPDGKFRTSLKSTLEIYRHGPQGELLERIDLPETVDICRTHRRDYFHSYQFTIPTKLALGPHVLKLSVEDQLSRRVGTYTLNFMVK
ncbi:MAG TPA: hypothetical protein VKU82_16035 [Planctomycetaceae bacterium]|nr:hypothetical protein [Planctomycetaceae bacterium]